MDNDLKVGNYVRCSFQPLTKGKIIWIEEKIMGIRELRAEQQAKLNSG